jgi:transcriptional regulator with XRE-family HTH domain
MSLSQRLKERRKLKKITQEKLAEKLNIKRSTYAKYETGENEPDYETLKLLADFFETTVDYLLGRNNDPSPSKEGLAFFGGPDEELTEDEKEHLKESLEQFRKLKAKFLSRNNE